MCKPLVSKTSGGLTREMFDKFKAMTIQKNKEEMTSGGMVWPETDETLPVKLSDSLTAKLNAGPLQAGTTIEVKLEQDREEEEDVK